MEKKKPGKAKKTAILLLKLIVSTTLMTLVLKGAGVDKVFGLLLGADPLLFGAAILVFLVIMAICSIRWGMLLPDHFSFRRLYPLQLIGAFFNIFMPGLVGGDALKVYYLYKEMGQGARALASVFMDRYLGYSALMLMGALAYPFGMKYFTEPWTKLLLPGIVCGFVIVSLVLFLARPGGRFAFVGKVHDMFHIYWSDKPMLARAVGLSLGIHVLSATSVWLVAASIGEPVGLLTLMVFVPVIATLAALPISVSGLGIREYAFIMLLGAIGVSKESAAAISLGWFITMSLGGLPGVLFFLLEKGKARNVSGAAAGDQK